MSKTKSGFLLITLLMLALQGCCTVAVSNIGVQSESLQRCERVSVGADGSIAAVVNSVFHKEAPLSKAYWDKSRIVFASPEVLRRSVTSSSARVDGTLLVDVEITDEKSDGWHMLPVLLDKSDNFLDHLPNSFRNTTVYNSCAFDYPVDKRKQEVYLSKFYFRHNSKLSAKRVYKKVWHYPAQVLLLPAFVFDVTTAPLQLFIIGHIIGKNPR